MPGEVGGRGVFCANYSQSFPGGATRPEPESTASDEPSGRPETPAEEPSGQVDHTVVPSMAETPEAAVQQLLDLRQTGDHRNANPGLGGTLDQPDPVGRSTGDTELGFGPVGRVHPVGW